MALQQTEPQSIYIGSTPVIKVMKGSTQVWPSGWTYSYTFKGKTATEIGNTWTLLTGTLQTNSDGVTGSSSTDCRIKVDIPSLANAKRIVVTQTVVVNTNGSNGAYSGIGVGSGWGTGSVLYLVFGSIYNGMRVTGVGNDGNVVGNATAGETYTPTITIDLENKTVVGTMSGFSNSTFSLTDTAVAEIRAFTYLVVYASLNKSAVSDVSITIE